MNGDSLAIKFRHAMNTYCITVCHVKMTAQARSRAPNDNAHAQDRAGAPDVSSYAQDRAGAPDVAVRMRRTGLAHRMWQCACAGQGWCTGCVSSHPKEPYHKTSTGPGVA
jgi:hypothetical protein